MQPKRHALANQKGGVGKTSLSCATGLAHTEAGKTVLIEQVPTSPTLHAKVTSKEAAQLKACWSEAISPVLDNPRKRLAGLLRCVRPRAVIQT